MGLRALLGRARSTRAAPRLGHPACHGWMTRRAGARRGPARRSRAAHGLRGSERSQPGDRTSAVSRATHASGGSSSTRLLGFRSGHGHRSRREGPQRRRRAGRRTPPSRLWTPRRRSHPDGVSFEAASLVGRHLRPRRTGGPDRPPVVASLSSAPGCSRSGSPWRRAGAAMRGWRGRDAAAAGRGGGRRFPRCGRRL
jgi:hypothetical protein